MALKGLKSGIIRPTARDTLAAVDAVAREAGLPPATLPQQAEPEATRRTFLVKEDIELVQLNVRVRRSLGDQLADRARIEGTTQKTLICRALATAGFQVHPDDLRTTPAPRRRGSAKR